MEEKHYEIIVTGRQLVLLVASGVVLLVVAFALGLGVGLLQPRPAGAIGAVEGGGGPGGAGGMALVAPEPTVVVSRGLDAARRGAALAGPTTPLPGRSPAPPVLPSPTPGGRPTVPAPTIPAPTPTSLPRTPVPSPLPVPPSPAPPRLGMTQGVWVQIGALSHQDQAQALRQRAEALGFDSAQVRIQRAPDGNYRVQLGPFPDAESAGRVVARLRLQGFPDAFMVRE